MNLDDHDEIDRIPDHPADLIASEHQVVLAVLDALDAEASRLRGEGQLRAAFWRDAVEFLTDFVDGAHIQKEEQVLFPAMVRCGFPASPGPLTALGKDHGDERELLDQIRASLAAGDAAVLARAARTYADFLRDHVAREDNVLLEMARHVLRGDDACRARDAILGFDDAAGDPERTARHRRLAQRMCADAGIEFARLRRPPFDGRCSHS